MTGVRREPLTRVKNLFLTRHLQRGRLTGLALIAAGGLTLSACQGGIDSVFPKAETPIPAHLIQKMKAKGMKPSSPILMRIYKTENVLEVWKRKDTGRFALLETYEICKWSGKLGPKFKEGDRQAPEGFYRVGKAQMNPQSQYHLSFNIGFPNTYDRAHGRTGSHLMVHGACSSAGCYSMTDEFVEEIYAMAREAHQGGQEAFQVQAYPFRMTARNLAKHAGHKHFEYWKMLKEGSDLFELTHYPPKVDVCEKRYLFNREAPDGEHFSSRSDCPAVTMPEKLLSKWKEHLEGEKAEFAKALKRHKLLGTYKNTALANVDVETISMMAKGSEILPAPTPIPEPEPVPAPVAEAPEPAPAPDPAIAAVEPDTQPGTATSGVSETGLTSAQENEAMLAGREITPAPAQAPQLEPTVQQVEQPRPSDETQAVAAAPVEADTVETPDPQPADGERNVTVVRAIPVPVRAPRGEASAAPQSGTEPAASQSAGQAAAPAQSAPKKRPWWLRKSKSDEPTSLIQPKS